MKQKIDISFFNFAEVKQPEFREQKISGEKYIRFGEDNLYPDYLITLFNSSPKHGAILKGKSTYIVGNGFANDQVVNDHGETKNDILKKVAFDLCLNGGFYIQVIPSVISGGKEQYYHVPFRNFRSNKENTIFFFKEDWKDFKEQPKIYPAYRQGKGGVLFYKEYRPGLNVYPLPDYFSALNDIAADVEVQKHVYNNAAGGFTPTKFIQFFNGQPTEEEKRKIEAGFDKKFSGSTGRKFIIAYNKASDKEVAIDDLGASDLTKENFDHINLLIQQEIFSGHGVTSPILFGIKTEGQLGGRSEMIDAYEIFTNTYVNNKQQQIENVFNYLFGQDKIQPCDPIGFRLDDRDIISVAPRSWLLEKMGIDPNKYPDAAPVTPKSDVQPVQNEANENIKNLTGRQHQQVMRIIRQYSQGKMTKEQAVTMLKSGYGLADEEIFSLLGIDETFSAQDDLKVFAEFGDSADKYIVVKEKKVFFESQEDCMREELNFLETGFMSALESSIVDLIKKDKRVTPEIIAKTLGISVSSAEAYLKSLSESGIVKTKTEKIGEDIQIVRTTVPIKDIPDFEQPLTTQIYIRYKYVGPDDSKTRDFCKHLLDLGRIYSRAEIETMSQRLGYSVWDRRGGWWGDKPYCRHSWVQQIVIKKK